MRECAILYKKKLHECKNTSIPPKFSITIRLHWIWNSRQICSFILIVWPISLSVTVEIHLFVSFLLMHHRLKHTYIISRNVRENLPLNECRNTWAEWLKSCLLKSNWAQNVYSVFNCLQVTCERCSCTRPDLQTTWWRP